jgi:hypothetical protein
MDEESTFEYELCTSPASLFDDSGTFRKPNKPELTKAINRLLKIDTIWGKS